MGHSEVPSPLLSALPRLAVGHVNAILHEPRLNWQASELMVRFLAREHLRIIGGETGIGLGH